VFTHGGGASQHYLGYILVLPLPNVTNYNALGTCLVEYNRISNGMRLINDMGRGWIGGESGVPIAPGAQPLSNAVCTLDVASSTAVVNGNTMTVDAAITFKPTGFAGPLGTFIQAQDVNGKWTDMRQFGNWVPYTSATPRPGPHVMNISPLSGAGSSATFTLNYGHTTSVNGSRVHLLFDTRIVGHAPCHVIYFGSTNTLNLVSDDGQSLVHPTGAGVGAVGAPVIANSRCRVDAAGASRIQQTQNATVNLPMTFTEAFAGSKSVYMNVFDTSSTLTHWIQAGVWTIP
jgi:hypothetical protein